MGTGIIDKKAHFLIFIFEAIYPKLQKKEKITITIPLGMKMKILSNDPGIGLNFLLRKEYEPTTTRLFIENIKPNYKVLDIGANYGYFTLLASKLAGSGGKIFAFEPDPENLMILKENLKLNKCTNVKIENSAISDQIGGINFIQQKFNKGESAVAKGAEGTKVSSTTLDSYFSKKAQNIDVMKIDIEGYEMKALLGAKKLIARSHKLKLFIEYNPERLSYYGDTPETLLKMLKKLGFREIFIIDEHSNKLIPYSSKNLNLALRNKTYFNLLCLRV